MADKYVGDDAVDAAGREAVDARTEEELSVPLEADCPHCGRLVQLRAPLALVAGALTWSRVEAKVDAIAARVGLVTRRDGQLVPGALAGLGSRRDKHRGVGQATVRHCACPACSARGRLAGRYGPELECLVTAEPVLCPDCREPGTTMQVSEKLS